MDAGWIAAAQWSQSMSKRACMMADMKPWEVGKAGTGALLSPVRLPQLTPLQQLRQGLLNVVAHFGSGLGQHSMHSIQQRGTALVQLPCTMSVWSRGARVERKGAGCKMGPESATGSRPALPSVLPVFRRAAACVGWARNQQPAT